MTTEPKALLADGDTYGLLADVNLRISDEDIHTFKAFSICKSKSTGPFVSATAPQVSYFLVLLGKTSNLFAKDAHASWVFLRLTGSSTAAISRKAESSDCSVVIKTLVSDDEAALENATVTISGISEAQANTLADSIRKLIETGVKGKANLRKVVSYVHLKRIESLNRKEIDEVVARLKTPLMSYSSMSRRPSSSDSVPRSPVYASAAKNAPLNSLDGPHPSAAQKPPSSSTSKHIPYSAPISQRAKQLSHAASSTHPDSSFSSSSSSSSRIAPIDRSFGIHPLTSSPFTPPPKRGNVSENEEEREGRSPPRHPVSPQKENFDMYAPKAKHPSPTPAAVPANRPRPNTISSLFGNASSSSSSSSSSSKMDVILHPVGNRTGFENTGNLCYMNSVVYALASLPLFSNSITDPSLHQKHHHEPTPEDIQAYERRRSAKGLDNAKRQRVEESTPPRKAMTALPPTKPFFLPQSKSKKVVHEDDYGDNLLSPPKPQTKRLSLVDDSDDELEIVDDPQIAASTIPPSSPAPDAAVVTSSVATPPPSASPMLCIDEEDRQPNPPDIDENKSLTQRLPADLETKMKKHCVFCHSAEAVRRFVNPGRNSPLLLATLKTAVAHYNDTFDNTFQQDAHEFLTTLLDRISEDLKTHMHPPLPIHITAASPKKEGKGEVIDVDMQESAVISVEKEGKRPASASHRKPSVYQVDLARFQANCDPIYSQFCGELENIMICMSCENKSSKFDLFTCLSLDLPEIDDKSMKNISVQDLLHFFFAERELEYKCEKCHQSTYCKSYQRFSIPPKVLVVQIKRFYHVMTATKTFALRKRKEPIIINKLIRAEEPQSNDARFKPILKAHIRNADQSDESIGEDAVQMDMSTYSDKIQDALIHAATASSSAPASSSALAASSSAPSSAIKSTIGEKRKSMAISSSSSSSHKEEEEEEEEFTFDFGSNDDEPKKVVVDLMNEEEEEQKVRQHEQIHRHTILSEEKMEKNRRIAQDEEIARKLQEEEERGSRRSRQAAASVAAPILSPNPVDSQGDCDEFREVHHEPAPFNLSKLKQSSKHSPHRLSAPHVSNAASSACHGVMDLDEEEPEIHYDDSVQELTSEQMMRNNYSSSPSSSSSSSKPKTGLFGGAGNDDIIPKRAPSSFSATRNHPVEEINSDSDGQEEVRQQINDFQASRTSSSSQPQPPDRSRLPRFGSLANRETESSAAHGKSIPASSSSSASSFHPLSSSFDDSRQIIGEMTMDSERASAIPIRTFGKQKGGHGTEALERVFHGAGSSAPVRSYSNKFSAAPGHQTTLSFGPQSSKRHGGVSNLPPSPSSSRPASPSDEADADMKKALEASLRTAEEEKSKKSSSFECDQEDASEEAALKRAIAESLQESQPKDESDYSYWNDDWQQKQEIDVTVDDDDADFDRLLNTDLRASSSSKNAFVSSNIGDKDMLFTAGDDDQSTGRSANGAKVNGISSSKSSSSSSGYGSYSSSNAGSSSNNNNNGFLGSGRRLRSDDNKEQEALVGELRRKQKADTDAEQDLIRRLDKGEISVKEAKTSYRLVADVMHRGATCHSGHYVTDVRDLVDNKWKHADDSWVDAIDEEVALGSDRRDSCYLLIFLRADFAHAFVHEARAHRPNSSSNRCSK